MNKWHIVHLKTDYYLAQKVNGLSRWEDVEKTWMCMTK